MVFTFLEIKHHVLELIELNNQDASKPTIEYAFLIPNEGDKSVEVSFITSIPLKAMMEQYLLATLSTKNYWTNSFNCYMESTKTHITINASYYSLSRLFTYSLTREDPLLSFLFLQDNILYSSEEFTNKILSVKEILCPSIEELSRKVCQEMQACYSTGSVLFDRGYRPPDNNYLKELNRATVLVLFYYYLSNYSPTAPLSSILTKEQIELYSLVTSCIRIWPYFFECKKKLADKFVIPSEYSEHSAVLKRNQRIFDVLYRFILDKEYPLTVIAPS